MIQKKFVFFKKICLLDQSAENNFYLQGKNIFTSGGCKKKYLLLEACEVETIFFTLESLLYFNKNDDDVTLFCSHGPFIQTTLDHQRQPIVYLGQNIDYVHSSKLFRLVYIKYVMVNA